MKSVHSGRLRSMPLLLLPLGAVYNLKPKSREISFAISLLFILPIVLNFCTEHGNDVTGQLKWMIWMNEISRDLGLRWVSEGYPILNQNYNILHEHLKSLKDKHMPDRYVKFHKHRHKKNKWITTGIIRSIKFRDNLYIKLKQCTVDTLEYANLKNNLKVFNWILKRTIREAKIQYYNQLFNKYAGDIKMTWKTISEIICKSNNKRNELEKIIVGSKVIVDKTEICNKFNDFFCEIGPKLANNITTDNKRGYETYMKERVLTSFTFNLVEESDVTKYLTTLRTNNSSGHDGISVKLLKFLSSAMIKPLTLIINQSLLTGIFPEKLKIAKVPPFFKKKMTSQLWITTARCRYSQQHPKCLKKLLTYNCMIISIKTICFTAASMGSVKYTLPSWQD